MVDVPHFLRQLQFLGCFSDDDILSSYKLLKGRIMRLHFRKFEKDIEDNYHKKVTLMM